mmetsp:Transcript_3195/g.5403  ORF Transcript_3195/g.5403 Transcript_3195/m.5403 type:complete len:85 (-) Transcript_3195:340-594(-)
MPATGITSHITFRQVHVCYAFDAVNANCLCPVLSTLLLIQRMNDVDCFLFFIDHVNLINLCGLTVQGYDMVGTGAICRALLMDS